MARSAAEQDDLLNIKQAARLLSVSEISLRRWTDSGKLACLRVGPKRERRFRRADLFAFVENQPAAPAPRPAAAAGDQAPGISLNGVHIALGDHLCSLYSNDLGRLKLSVPFLAGGLRAGDVCYLVAGRSERDHILENLREVSDGVDRAMADGLLILSEGLSTARDMLDFLELNFTMTTRSGNRMLRLLGDMVWAKHQGMERAELMAFEMRYNSEIARRFPVVSLCQYDAREFSGTDVHEVLIGHQDTFNYSLASFL